MLPFPELHDGPVDRLRDAPPVAADLLSEAIGKPRLPMRIARLIEAGAWTDAALALLETLPQWRLRRLAFDDGEWHCALARRRELPDWLDDAIEAHHADLALAILSAFTEARREPAPPASAPAVPRPLLYEPVCCENFA
ncbi:MAG TPA: hypothetical protein VFQ87_04905 [Bradyrhizobium sp.]|jgi:hypothetical protein|nr:hypothetical protein [Bradyrhizobium sp.]